MNLRSLPLVGDAKQVSPWIEMFARVGFVAKGVLYMTIGALAASAALGMGGKSDPDSKHALQKLFEAPFGRVLVAVVALGLVGYGAWRIIEGFTDPQNRGHGAKGIAMRVGSVARGVIHLGLAFAAGMLAIYREGSGGGGGEIRTYVAKAMTMPGGTYALMAVAAGLLGYGGWQLYCAFKAKLSKQLQLGQVSETLRPWIFGVSRFGIAARGVVFGMLAVLLYRAARDHDPRQAGGLGDGLRHLFVEVGRWPYFVIALGLGAYGVYEVINARYRRIDV
jgi:TRAP-type C4-dicarboxylate transport system permease small subunit